MHISKFLYITIWPFYS